MQLADSSPRFREVIAIPEDAALLLINFQRAFEPPLPGDSGAPGAMRNNPDAEHRASLLLDTWRQYGMPVIHVRHDSRSICSPLRPGKPTNEFSSLVQPRKSEPVYPVHVNCAFMDTTLERDLRALHIRTLVLAGLATDQCISTSARIADSLGFTPLVVSDAAATFDREGPDGLRYPAALLHRAALASLSGDGAIIVTTAETIEGVHRSVAETRSFQR